MRRAPLLIALALCLCIRDARADGAADARAVVDRALKEMGGAEKLAKLPAATWKGKGHVTVQALGSPAPFSGEWLVQAPGKMKWTLELEVGGNKTRLTHILNGDNGWQVNGDTVTDMADDLLEALRDEMHVNWVVGLVALQDKAFKLAPLPEIQVGGRAAVGVKATYKGRPDVSLYFDKETGLLVRSVNRTKYHPDKGQFDQETEFFDYKKVDGVMWPAQATVKVDGKTYIEVMRTDYKSLEKVDPKEFQRP